MSRLGYNDKIGIDSYDIGMSLFSRRSFSRALVGAGLAVPWIFGEWGTASAQVADNDFFLINGWIVKRSQVPEEALRRASPLVF